MSGVEISKILNLLAETEIREENSSAKKLDNLSKLWNRNNEKLQERLAKVDKEIAAQKSLKNEVETLKNRILELNGNEKANKSKIFELKSLLNETVNEIRLQQSEENKLRQHYESRKRELGELEKVKNLLKTQQSLYDHCLSTRLCCEASDLYKLLFVNNEKCVGWIKFEYIEDKNRFKVVGTDPKSLVTDAIVNKFHETQDSQGLLCYIFQNLKE